MRRGLKGDYVGLVAPRVVSCRPFPDEEGTESRKAPAAGPFERRVADRSPMRRGLKEMRRWLPDIT